MVNTLDAFANALCCNSLEGLECILRYHYRKFKFLHKLVSSQSKFIDDVISDCDEDASMNVKITMSDVKAAKKLRKLIENVIDEHDTDGYTLIIYNDENVITLIIDSEEEL